MGVKFLAFKLLYTTQISKTSSYIAELNRFGGVVFLEELSMTSLKVTSFPQLDMHGNSVLNSVLTFMKV